MIGSLKLTVLVALIFYILQCTGEETESFTSQWKNRLSQNLEWLYGPAQSCRYRTNLSRAVNETLHSHISGQDESLEYIVNAVSVWEMQKKMDHEEPLVLAITGPTGVGKTETAYRLAEALFADKRVITSDFGSQTQVPCGLLVLRGEDYSPSSDLAALGVHEVHRVLKTRIIDHLVLNNGNAMVLFDEVQKLLPGVLELFMPALGERGSISSTTYTSAPTSTPTVASYTQYTTQVLSSTLSSIWQPSNQPTSSPPPNDAQDDTEEYMDEEDMAEESNKCANGVCKANAHAPTQSQRHTHTPVYKSYPTDRVVFVFVTDVGVERITRHLILQDDGGDDEGSEGGKGRGRGGVSLDSINNEVKQVMDETFARLKLGKVINTIVPYLPMEKKQVEGVLRLHLQKYQAQFRHRQWLSMYVDSNVYGYMSSPPYVTYKNHTLQYKIQGGKDVGEGRALDVVGGSQAQVITKSKRFATYGARGIKTGPLHRLQALVSRYMQPYKADKVLHIGLLAQHNLQRSQELWGNENVQDMQIYLQWCTPDPSMLTSSYTHMLPPPPTSPPRGKAGSADYQSQLNRYQRALHDIISMHDDSVYVSDDIAFSRLCDTKWFGKITK